MSANSQGVAKPAAPDVHNFSLRDLPRFNFPTTTRQVLSSLASRMLYAHNNGGIGTLLHFLKCSRTGELKTDSRPSRRAAVARGVTTFTTTQSAACNAWTKSRLCLGGHLATGSRHNLVFAEFPTVMQTAHTRMLQQRYFVFCVFVFLCSFVPSILVAS